MEREEKMNIANNWEDYKILDMADGQKLGKIGTLRISMDNLK